MGAAARVLLVSVVFSGGMGCGEQVPDEIQQARKAIIGKWKLAKTYGIPESEAPQRLIFAKKTIILEFEGKRIERKCTLDSLDVITIDGDPKGPFHYSYKLWRATLSLEHNGRSMSFFRE